MKGNYLFNLFLLLVVFTSCSRESPSEEFIIEIDLDRNSGGSYSDFFSSIDYKLLKTNEVNPLVQPYKIIINDSLIFVSDMAQEHILIFNEKGDNISAIKNVGQGPEEYQSLDDYHIQDNYLWLKDGLSGKMVKFDLNGNFIKSESNKFLRGNFYLGDEYNLYYLNNDPEYNGRILRVSSKGIETTLEMKPWLQKRLNRHINGFFSPMNSEFIYFMLPFTYEIAEFEKTNGKLKNIYKFDFKKFNFPDIKREELGDIGEEIDYAIKNSLVYDLSNFLPVGSGYLVFLRQESGKSHFIFLNSEFGVEKQFSQFDNDLDGFVIKNMPWTFSAGKIYFTMHSRQFLNEYKMQFEEGLNSNQNIHKFYNENMEYFDDENLVLIGLTVK